MWLQGPRVVSVAWPGVIFSSMKKTSLFVKSPQEQSVPLRQECVTCAESSHVCVRVCAGASLVAGWLAGVSVAFGLSLGSLAGEPCYYQSSVTHSYTDVTKDAFDYTAAFRYFFLI